MRLHHIAFHHTQYTLYINKTHEIYKIEEIAEIHVALENELNNLTLKGFEELQVGFDSPAISCSTHLLKILGTFQVSFIYNM